MRIENQAIYTEAVRILRSMYGEDAQFREGQYEAIEATMTRKRTVVVQKTGWGKSLVYFLCTELKRARGQGMTLIISPLLVLMENQMEMARRMGLRCAALNSRVRDKEERQNILLGMANDQLDAVFITPETLLKDEMQAQLPNIRIGLFVVDEAHCISDWGHDFRLDYGRIGRIISGAFSNTAVLATTATANNRVLDDLKKQLGDEVYISRGPLTRESLHMQVLPLEEKADRYAWLLENLPKLPGTGIIYCLDKRDCDRLAEFLQQNGISAMSYYARNEREEDANDAAMEAFRTNQIKAIVATIKLGMGYDKGDVAFVIHFQSPSNVVAWYQQIGRAGRNLRDAYVFLMHGSEDQAIKEYFIQTAFPTREEAEKVIACISNANGLTKNEILQQVNIRSARAEKAMYFMEKEGFVRHEEVGKKRCYFPTIRRFVYDEAHYQAIREIRYEEMAQMNQLMTTRRCLSRFAVNCLDDWTARDCGKCANCTGRDILPGLTRSAASGQIAAAYIAKQLLPIEPRKRWYDNKSIPEALRLQPGICLAKYGEAGYGAMVAQGKYPKYGEPQHFHEALVVKAASVLETLIREQQITHITCVPSLRSDVVKDFAIRLARRTGATSAELLGKMPAPQQKTMENSAFQCQNVMDSVFVKEVLMPERVILVDDVVDSKWTLTVCGYKLLESGCQAVYPFALADSSHSEE